MSGRPSLMRAAACALVVSGLSLASCSHIQLKKDEDAVNALGHICAYGADNFKVTGSVWLKAASPEARGQFPAEVEVTSPDRVLMEVTNLIGETQAKIQVSGGTYRIDSPTGKTQAQEGYGNWGGIPLAWAAPLFLGRFPCPEDLSDHRLAIRREVDDVIVAQKVDSSGRPLEEYYYRVRDWGGEAWPEEVQWTRSGETPLTVVFRFDRPDPETGAATRWEAKSDRGEVKVRWRKRVVEKSVEKSSEKNDSGKNASNS